MQVLDTTNHRAPRAIQTGRSARVLGLAALMLLSSLVFLTSPAGADGVDINGCTGVPDSGYGFDFNEICDDHDRCYGMQPYGDGWRGRRSCDRSFRSAMFGYCKQHDWFSSKRTTCDSVAVAYYLGVRAFGWVYWQDEVPTIIA